MIANTLNLLPWQLAQRHKRHLRYLKWASGLIAASILLSVSLSGLFILAARHNRILSQVKLKQLHQFQPILFNLHQLQKQLDQMEFEQTQVTDIQLWHQKWRCYWQNMVQTTPSGVSWQRAVFSTQQVQIHGQTHDPSQFIPWAHQVQCQISQQTWQVSKTPKVFDFDLVLIPLIQ